MLKTIAKLLLAAAALTAQGPALAAPDATSVDLRFYGDLYLSRRAIRTTQSSFIDPRLFRDVRPLLRQATVNVVNFEGAATAAFVPHGFKSFLLKMPLETPEILYRVGIHVALLANNHAMDFGFAGLFDTIVGLNQVGIATTGAGPNLNEALRPVILKAHDRSVCLLAFSRTLPESFYATDDRPGTAYVDFDRTAAEVQACAREGHFTIANFHWGEELVYTPKQYQRDLARLAIRSGADAVIGHHPHVLQDVELYRGRLIFYSLGNFLFATRPNGVGPQGMAVGIRFPRKSGEPLSYVLTALQVDNRIVKMVPRPLAEEEEDPLLGRLPAGVCVRLKHGTYRCDTSARLKAAIAPLP